MLDFGISKIADTGSENRSLTQTGTALGTPYYMAPEQCQGKKDIDPRADIYSLGVILFQALTRQYPFDDESYPMLVLKICTEPPPAARALPAGRPAAAAGDRQPDAGEGSQPALLRAATRFARPSSPSAASTTPP